MNKYIKILLYVIAGIEIVIAGLLTYLKTMLPDVGDAPDIKIELTPDRIERGKYLANNVMVCIDCHSTRDWSKFAGPPIEGTFGKGGEVFDQKLGFPGKFVAINITPANLKSWTDGEIFRAVAGGVGKDGRALFPIMPHIGYGQLDEEDIKFVIAYIRTLEPIENKTEASEADFPMNFILNTIPQKPNFSKIPSKSDKVAYGKYLVTAASCNDCHTKQDKGKFVGAPFAGGFEFKLPDGSVVTSANITPHPSGIGNWTEEKFIARFKHYVDSTYVSNQIKPGEFQSMMTWTMYGGITNEDLSAIYHFLKTLKPENNIISVFKPAK